MWDSVLEVPVRWPRKVFEGGRADCHRSILLDLPDWTTSRVGSILLDLLDWTASGSERALYPRSEIGDERLEVKLQDSH